MGIAIPPDESDAVLIVDANAVAPGVSSLQGLQSVAGGRPEIIKLGCDIQQLQLSLDHSPQIAWNPTGRARVPFPEQVGRGLVAK